MNQEQDEELLNQDPNSNDQNSKIQQKTFNIQLAPIQATFLSKIIPKTYSLQIERDIKPRATKSKKKTLTTKKQTSSHLIANEELSQRMVKSKSSQRYSQDIKSLNNYSRAASQGYYEEIEDFMKPCLRILHMLKNHKTSWPFKEPVDPIAMNIPNYLEIIKQPMDLSTVQKNLKSKVYVTPTQFHADVGKIIRNSYEFNKNNADYCKLTSEFEQYYNKINNDSSGSRSLVFNPSLNTQPDNKKKKIKNNSKPIHQKLKSFDESQPATLAEKKALTLEIKKLPRQNMKDIIQIVFQGKPPTSEELNIEKLPLAKIRQLQRYVQEKSSRYETVSGQDKNQSQRAGDNDQQSSFQSDSES